MTCAGSPSRAVIYALNHRSAYDSLLLPPRFREGLILLRDSIPVVEALSRMLPQLFRPDPAMSGTSRGIIIGQDFILLTHHDIPAQPPTLRSTPDCQGRRCVNAFQISRCATGVKATRPDERRVQGGPPLTPPRRCKPGLYRTRVRSGCCQLRSGSRWPGPCCIV